MKTYKELKEEISIITESGYSRLRDHFTNHEYGTISAFRNARDCNRGKKYTIRENLQRNASLVAKLRAKGYSVTKIKGLYVEDLIKKMQDREEKLKRGEEAEEIKGKAEKSFVVVDIQDRGTLKKDLMELGEEFEQDSIIFGKPGKDAYLYGTNKCEGGFPGYGKNVRLGRAIFGFEDENMSKVNNRPFIFADEIPNYDKDDEVKSEQYEIEEEYGVCKFPSELRGPVLMSRINWWELEDHLL